MPLQMISKSLTGKALSFTPVPVAQIPLIQCSAHGLFMSEPELVYLDLLQEKYVGKTGENVVASCKMGCEIMPRLYIFPSYM